MLFPRKVIGVKVILRGIFIVISLPYEVFSAGLVTPRADSLVRWRVDVQVVRGRHPSTLQNRAKTPFIVPWAPVMVWQLSDSKVDWVFLSIFPTTCPLACKWKGLLKYGKARTRKETFGVWNASSTSSFYSILICSLVSQSYLWAQLVVRRGCGFHRIHKPPRSPLILVLCFGLEYSWRIYVFSRYTFLIYYTPQEGCFVPHQQGHGF